MHQPAPASIPGSDRHRCVVCNEPIDIHQFVRGNICSSVSCQTQKAVDENLKLQAIEKRKIQETAKNAVAAVYGSKFTHAVIPYQQSRLVPADPQRAKAFRKNLRQVIRTAVSQNIEPEVASNSTSENSETDHDRRLAKTCITCKGHCCHQGETHAFIKAPQIAAILANQPGLKLADLYRTYIRLLPVTSFENSCIYQSEQGCNLPRHLRSSICNNFECEPRTLVADTLSEDPQQPIALVAMERVKVFAIVEI